MFINYDVNTGLSINTFRKPNGYANDDIGGLVEDVLAEKNTCCPPEGAKELLEDGSCWNGSNVTPELPEELHALICDYEAEAE